VGLFKVGKGSMEDGWRGRGSVDRLGRRDVVEFDVNRQRFYERDATAIYCSLLTLQSHV
jgi:hypothetical protein